MSQVAKMYPFAVISVIALLSIIVQSVGRAEAQVPSSRRSLCNTFGGCSPAYLSADGDDNLGLASFGRRRNNFAAGANGPSLSMGRAIRIQGRGGGGGRSENNKHRRHGLGARHRSHLRGGHQTGRQHL